MDRRILGKRIREERTRIGLTQEQIAEYMDVSTTYIGLVERGERAVTLEKLVLLAECFHVTVDSLLREAERQESLDKKEQLLFLWSRAVPEDQDKILAIMDIIIHGASRVRRSVTRWGKRVRRSAAGWGKRAYAGKRHSRETAYIIPAEAPHFRIRRIYARRHTKKMQKISASFCMPILPAQFPHPNIS